MSLFNPDSAKGFRLSRSKVEDFLNCARCFYLDRRLGIRKPSLPPFNLNNAVDTLLKKEFDHYRASGMPHPLMKAHGLQAVPYADARMDLWREALRGGIRFLDPQTGFELTGAPDDLWMDAEGQLIVVDYKATSKPEDPNINAEWQNTYKRQVEFYQYLFRANSFKVSETAYFVYANALTSSDAFDHRLTFSLHLLRHHGRTDWIQPTLHSIHNCLTAEEIPPASSDCEWCAYTANIQKAATKPFQKSLL